MRYNQHHQHLTPSVSLAGLTKICKEKNEKKPIRRTYAYIFVIVSTITTHSACAPVIKKKLADDDDENTLWHLTHA